MKRLYFFEPFIAVNFLLIQALLWHITRTPLRSFFKDFAVLVPAFLVQALVGIAVRAAIQRRAYGIAIRSKAWLADTARLILFSVLSVQTYCWIKLAVPLLHHGLFDEQLRDISRALFFGHSPNILLIDLFANPVAMRAVDWSYANVFIASINIASVYFISDPDRRIRVGFMNSNTLMWITGAWLYVLVPSLGPAYVFPRFYLSLAPHLPETQELQRILMYNYQNVLHNGPVNLFYGIAAFPSLHVAFEFLVWLWLRRVWRPGAIAFAIFTVVIFIGSIVTGWHYLIDSLAGLALAASCFYGVRGRLQPSEVTG